MAVLTHTFYSSEGSLLNNVAVTNITPILENLWGAGAVVWQPLPLQDFVASGNGSILEITLDNTTGLRNLNITAKRKVRTKRDNAPVIPDGGVLPMPIPFNSFNNPSNIKYIFRLRREHLNSFLSDLSFSLGRDNNNLFLVVKFSPIVIQMQVDNNIYNAISLGSGGVKIPR